MKLQIAISKNGRGCQAPCSLHAQDGTHTTQYQIEPHETDNFVVVAQLLSCV